jgi:hypothetical protein
MPAMVSVLEQRDLDVIRRMARPKEGRGEKGKRRGRSQISERGRMPRYKACAIYLKFSKMLPLPEGQI